MPSRLTIIGAKMNRNFAKVGELLKHAKRALFITGAGVSAFWVEEGTE